jgi:outer membrane protein assembly factor BamB
MNTADSPELLFVGSGRLVTALDRFSGRPVWRRKLPRFFGGLVTLAASETELYVGRGGYVYCLDCQSGEVMWERGVGSAGASVLMTMRGLPADQQAAAVHAAQEAAARAAAAG